MLTFLRILTEALETEKDRINKRKLSVEEIDVYMNQYLIMTLLILMLTQA